MSMFAELKSIKPRLKDGIYLFEVEIQKDGTPVELPNPVTAEQLLDQTEFARIVARTCGYVLKEEPNWTEALERVWESPEPRRSGSNDLQEIIDDADNLGNLHDNDEDY